MTDSSVDRALLAARKRLDRVDPSDLEAALAAGAVLVDIRPHLDRLQYGPHPTALVVERNVLEWRFAGAPEDRIPGVEDGQQIILMCNEGYQSSLAAVTLQELGVTGATDLVGGYSGWLAHQE